MKTNKISFGAGLTPEIAQQIRKTNILQVSDNFAQRNIPTDFKDNKIIAWCANKTLEILEYINKTFGQNLALPKGIYVENFEKLHIPVSNMYGFCNLQPVRLFKDSGKIVPSRVIFFDSQESIANTHNGLTAWNFINSISDNRFSTNQSATNHFLDIFMHEFFHVSHEDRLLKMIGVNKLIELINMVKNKKYVSEYNLKYGKKLSGICEYALTNPFEAVACDMSQTVLDSLDIRTVMPKKNPFECSAYEDLSLLQRINLPNYSDGERPLIEILRNFWNGKFC